MVSNRKDVVCKLPCKAGWQSPDRDRDLPKALIAAEATDVLHQRVPGREQTSGHGCIFLQAKQNSEIAIWQYFGQVFIRVVDLDLQGLIH